MPRSRKRRTSGRKSRRRSAKAPAAAKSAKRRAPRRPKRRAKRRARGRKPRRQARRQRAARRASPALAARAAEDELREAVVVALVEHGYVPPDEIVVNVTCAVAAGYRKGPAIAPVQFASLADRDVADGFAEAYRLGDRSPGPDRASHLGSVRRFVDFDFEQVGPPDVGDPERDVLARIALGIWRPGVDEPSQKHMFVGPVCRWYRDGR